MCSIFGVTSKSIDRDTLMTCFDRTLSRGPDMSRFEEIPCGYLGFHRLAIMGLDERGMQPFHLMGMRWSATASCTASVRSGTGC